MMRLTTLWCVGILILACGGNSSGADGGQPADSASRFEPPVAINAESPISYPPQLFREGVEGTVVLRLFADESGRLLLDSTRIEEGSGYPALDSAVLAGVDGMKFAPARQDGVPVATWFLQPVQFRKPNLASGGGR